MFDVDKSFTCFAYELSAAPGVGAAGRWFWSRHWAGDDVEVLGPSSWDLGGDLREVYFEK